MATSANFLFPQGARFEADNVVLHARAKRHTVNGFRGPLSIKTVVRGAVTWTLDGRAFAVDPRSFLVLGHAQEYSMAIDEPEEVETACAFFRTGFVEQVAVSAAAPVERSLEDPDRPAPPLPYLARHHRDGGHVVARTQTLARRCRDGLLPASVEEDFLLLAVDLLFLYEEIRRQAERVPAAKVATREELFRRLETAREFMHAHAGGPLSLEAAARAACLSRYHFHRLFREVHGQTPHGYAMAIRLGRARDLLAKGTAIEQVCEQLGFGSASAFSRLFRSRFGHPPGRTRK